MSATAVEGRQWIWFFAWMAVGAGYALGVLGALTIGLFVLIITVVATILLRRDPRSPAGLPGLVSGLSLPLFYVAYLNRAGPGTICRAIGAGGQECTDEWSPWPWLVIGLLLLLGGFVQFVRANRGRDVTSAPA